MKKAARIYNPFKVIYFPIFIVLISILIVSVSSFLISRNFALEQMRSDGIEFAKLLSRKIQHVVPNLQNLDALSESERMNILNELQALVDNTTNEDNILYTLVINKDYVAVVDSDRADIGIDYSNDEDYVKVFNGFSVAEFWYYEKIGANVLEVATPIAMEGKYIGIVAVGINMDNIYENLRIIAAVFSVIGIGAFFLFYFVQRHNIVKPLKVLSLALDSIEVSNGIFPKLSTEKRNSFFGLNATINDLQAEIVTHMQFLKEKEINIQILANQDSLTNLPNRRNFTAVLEHSMSIGENGFVYIIDLDDFKKINDERGHSFGDKVLIRIGIALSTIDPERLFVARFGGDEFVIVLRDEVDVTIAQDYAIKMNRIINEQKLMKNESIYLSSSIGISQYLKDGNHINKLLTKADIALYHVKNNNKNSYVFFSPEMAEKINENNRIERMIRKALSEETFELLFQPQVDCRTEEIVCFEALIRIKNDKISPAKFIPIAEKTGLIIPVGRWVTHEAIRQLKVWKDKGFTIKPVSINFSVLQFYDETYIDYLLELSNRYNIELNCLEIEVTENILSASTQENLVFLGRLKECGVSIALDDFGTGYSSLKYITYMPLDKIKLDKGLCDNYSDEKSIRVIESIIMLSHHLKLKVVAEGIENAIQNNLLSQLGCDYIQGYYYYKPLPIEKVEMLMRREKT